MINYLSKVKAINEDEYQEAEFILDETTLLSQALIYPENFAIIYEKYFIRIYQYCYRRIQDIEEAEDLTSLIFIQAFTKVSSYRGGSVAAWLFQIAHNLVINYLKKVRRQGRDKLLNSISVDPILYINNSENDTLQQLIKIENRQQLAKLVATLSNKDRELLALRFAGGLSTKEISAVLKKGESTVRVSLHRIVQKLRKHYQQSEEGG